MPSMFASTSLMKRKQLLLSVKILLTEFPSLNLAMITQKPATKITSEGNNGSQHSGFSAKILFKEAGTLMATDLLLIHSPTDFTLSLTCNPQDVNFFNRKVVLS